MSNKNVQTLRQPDECGDDPLTSMLKQGARQLIAQAVEAELQAYLDQHCDLGYLPERDIQTGLGSVPVKIPKVRDRSGNGNKFNSMLVPPYLKRIKSLDELLPYHIATSA